MSSLAFNRWYFRVEPANNTNPDQLQKKDAKVSRGCPKNGHPFREVKPQYLSYSSKNNLAGKLQPSLPMYVTGEFTHSADNVLGRDPWENLSETFGNCGYPITCCNRKRLHLQVSLCSSSKPKCPFKTRQALKCNQHTGSCKSKDDCAVLANALHATAQSLFKQRIPVGGIKGDALHRLLQNTPIFLKRKCCLFLSDSPTLCNGCNLLVFVHTANSLYPKQ